MVQHCITGRQSFYLLMPYPLSLLLYLCGSDMDDISVYYILFNVQYNL